VSTIDVSFTKYDGRPHRHTTSRLLGTDEHGTWLGSPAGTIVHFIKAGARVANPVPQVRLIPPGGWWTAIFLGGEPEPRLYCDITTPALWPSPAAVTFIDLDLDVEQFRDGAVTLLDEDEFAENQVLLGYPPDVVAGALAAAEHLMTAVTGAHEPFDTTYLRWLSQV
jgi:uncharacterized protein